MMYRYDLSAAGRRGLLWVTVGCLTVAGCGTKNHPVESDLARQSLEAALASWKQGEQPYALAARTPPITITDFAWQAGSKLANYRMIGEGTSDGYNMHYNVEIVITDPRAGTTTEQVTYFVATSPVITISRR